MQNVCLGSDTNEILVWQIEKLKSPVAKTLYMTTAVYDKFIHNF